MDDAFKFLFDRDLSDDERDKQKRKASEFRAPGGFYPDPTDAGYDPYSRLKRRLRGLFPHMPTPGMPPKLNDD